MLNLKFPVAGIGKFDGFMVSYIYLCQFQAILRGCVILVVTFMVKKCVGYKKGNAFTILHILLPNL